MSASTSALGRNNESRRRSDSREGSRRSRASTVMRDSSTRESNLGPPSPRKESKRNPSRTSNRKSIQPKEVAKLSASLSALNHYMDDDMDSEASDNSDGLSASFTALSVRKRRDGSPLGASYNDFTRRKDSTGRERRSSTRGKDGQPRKRKSRERGRNSRGSVPKDGSEMGSSSQRRKSKGNPTRRTSKSTDDPGKGGGKKKRDSRRRASRMVDDFDETETRPRRRVSSVQREDEAGGKGKRSSQESSSNEKGSPKKSKPKAPNNDSLAESNHVAGRLGNKLVVW